MPRRSPRSDTYTPSLQRWAASANMSRLAGITLAHVLAGDTCAPIGLEDFEAYLAFRDHSLENLQFVVWYQDYRKRFLALPENIQRRSPPPRRADSRYHPTIPTDIDADARSSYYDVTSPTQAHVDEKYNITRSYPPGLSLRGNVNATSGDGIPLTPISPTSPTSATPFATSFNLGRDREPPSPFAQALDFASNLASLQASAAHANLASLQSTDHLDGRRNSLMERHAQMESFEPVDQPFREECMCVLATFLSPNSRKELLLDAVVRDTAIKNLVWTTHPDIFQTMYDSIYDLLQTVSLRRFLEFSTSNINRPKQLFWYTVGFSDLFIGIAIALSLIMALSTPPQASRAWRLFSVPFVYSAWRGMCTQVFGRDAVQLRVWEMEEADEEALAYFDEFAFGGKRFSAGAVSGSGQAGGASMGGGGVSGCGNGGGGDRPGEGDDVKVGHAEAEESREALPAGIGGIGAGKRNSIAQIAPFADSEDPVDHAGIVGDGNGVNGVPVTAGMDGTFGKGNANAMSVMGNGNGHGNGNANANANGRLVITTPPLNKIEFAKEKASDSPIATSPTSLASASRIAPFNFPSQYPSSSPYPYSPQDFHPNSHNPIPPSQANPTHNSTYKYPADSHSHSHTSIPNGPRAVRTPRTPPTSRNGYHRPPIFGPERVVQDPRIKEVHKAVVRDILVVGALSIVVWSAVVLSVPGWHSR
ncbi:hypothetical protein BD410DRAFT_823929 [Rickenella mellea]|uniref:RGS domain-containing protein n=1 Tax=Rickenella mellea TaxID=50990 RepID=A0A4R5XFN4_9AGAM|nr:hypothetical protein BD410DRAFT_823929 [Rickenella mellea]